MNIIPGIDRALFFSAISNYALLDRNESINNSIRLKEYLIKIASEILFENLSVL